MITFEKIEQDGLEWFGKRYHELTPYQKGVVFYKAFQIKGVRHQDIATAVNLSDNRVGILISEVSKEVDICRKKGFRKTKDWRNG